MPGDIIILHKCTKNHDRRLYCSWDIVQGRENYFSFWAIFCPFTSQKWKKHLEVSSLYTVYHKWQSYDIWFLRYEVQQTEFFCHLGPFFLPFYSPNSPKNEHFKKMKKNLEISSFNTNVPKIIILCFTFLEIWCVTNVIIFHFGLFFALLPLQQHKKSKFLKNEKNTWRYHHFTHIYQLIRWCMVPKIWCAMNGRTEKVTYRGGCPTPKYNE